MLEIAYNLRSRKITKSKFVRTHGITRSKFVRTHRPPPWIARRMVEESAGEKLPEKSGEKLPEQQVTTALASPRRSPSEEPMTQEEMIAWNRKRWMTWADKALGHYNLKEDANFKLLEVRGVMMTTDMPSSYVHMNFKAESAAAAASPKLFFAESIMVPWEESEEHNVKVNGCCALKMVDSEDPTARECVICWRSSVVHPGPRYGYSSESGDNFAAEEWSFNRAARKST